MPWEEGTAALNLSFVQADSFFPTMLPRETPRKTRPNQTWDVDAGHIVIGGDRVSASGAAKCGTKTGDLKYG